MAVVLVTGGAGYIGSHTAKALAQAGHIPVTFDNFSTGYRWAVQYGPLFEGDLLDPAAIKAAVEQHKPEAVIHFAGLIEVGQSVREPVRYHQVNVGGSLNLMQEMLGAGLDKIVFSSTAAVYAQSPDGLSLTEDSTIGPASPYGQSKRAIEIALNDAAAAGALKPVILRYFNAAGATETAEIGEAHWPESHLVPLCLMAAAGDRPPLQLFGTDYETPDGTCIRDYVHVADLADAHVKAVDHLLSGGGPLTCNLGTGRGATVREVIEAAGRASGLDVPFEESPRRPGDVPVLVADPSRAAVDLGWQAEKSANLDQIIGDAWRWYQAAKTLGYLPPPGR